MKIKAFLILVIILAAILRLWDLTNYPAGFNADEASIGYNAYSILKTGRDEYGQFLPLNFKSFGDYKPGLYFYFVIPFIWLLGLAEFAVRLPSAILGIATVYLIYFLSKQIFNNKNIALLSAFLLAITPWHIHFSRGGWESNAATFFITLGFLLFLKGLEKANFLFWSLLSFLISIYLYQSPRLLVPLFLISLIFLYNRHLLKKLKNLTIFIPILFILSLPLFGEFLTGQGAARFSGLSFLSDPGPGSRTNELRGQHLNPSSLYSIILHNKFTSYGPSFLGHYLDHFSSQFLFIRGEDVIRNKVPETGQFYLVQAMFLILGIMYLTRSKLEHKKLLLAWLIISPTASAMTFQTPNALRSLNMVIPFSLIMGVGLYYLITITKKKLRFLIAFIIFFILGFEVIHYLESYYMHYPKRYPLAWEYGFKQMVSKLSIKQPLYNNVVITDRYDQPYILLLFYQKFDPVKYQPQARLSIRDKFNFGTIRSFDKYQFRQIDPKEIKNAKDTLFIGSEKEIPKDANIIDRVDFPNGQPAFLFVGT